MARDSIDAPDLDYVTDLSPGRGRRTQVRSWVESDAEALSLNGAWKFRLQPGLDDLDEVMIDIDYDDSGWDQLPVPAHWVLEGDGRYGRPIYTNVQYPFPLDPPYVPQDNPTGDYRRAFELTDWSAQRTLLRFDGVESVYRVWLNGREVGVGKGSRLVQEFDVTDLLRQGRNVLVVRVHQWSSMSYLEDQDQWWLPGIFRDVTLLARPLGCVDDVWLDAAYHQDGRGTVRVQVRAEAAAFPVVVEIAELDLRLELPAPGVHTADVGALVRPWSAEDPHRYRAEIISQGEKITLQTGFRTVRIVGDVFTVNGRQVIFRGMNRHETHPVRGRVFDHDHARADLIMMKRYGVNAVRTSHYPPHPGVLELADELGFWVVDECDLETHGLTFGAEPGNPSDQPEWREAYLDRIERTVERDKNHPCVVMWSLGNESGTGRNLAAMADWVHARDPGRPVHYEGDRSCAYTDVYSRMYPNLKETAAIGGETGAIYACGPAEARRIRSKPFVLCEYAHAMGNGPGALQEYDDLATRYRRLHGGFVWEWRDHGLATRAADGTEFYAYGGDFGETVHDGNFVMDGMVLPDDTAMPSLAEFAAVNSPVLLRIGDDGLTILNRYHSASTAALIFTVTEEIDGVERVSQEIAVPELAAGASVTLELSELPELPEPQNGHHGSGAEAGREVWWTVRAALAAPQSWAPAGHVVAWTQSRRTAVPTPAPVPSFTGRALDRRSGGLHLGPARFDRRTGRLTELFGVPVGGPQLELWRAPTDNDRAADRGSYELGDPDDGDGDGAPGPSSETRWRRRGLDRLVHRLLEVSAGHDELRVRVRTGAADSALGVDVVYHWRHHIEQLDLRVGVLPYGSWDCTWPRVGVRFELPTSVQRAEWFGTGPAESYPDSAAAARVGRFAGRVEDLCVTYSRPQETGHRGGLRDLRLFDGDGPQLRLRTHPGPDGHRPGFTVTRHTPAERAAARHPYELPEPSACWLYLDDAVHGLGSRACGFDVLPEHALWPGTRSFGISFLEPARS